VYIVVRFNIKSKRFESYRFLALAPVGGGLVSYFRLKNQSLVLIAGFLIGGVQFT